MADKVKVVEDIWLCASYSLSAFTLEQKNVKCWQISPELSGRLRDARKTAIRRHCFLSWLWLRRTCLLPFTPAP